MVVEVDTAVGAAAVELRRLLRVLRWVLQLLRWLLRPLLLDLVLKDLLVSVSLSQCEADSRWCPSVQSDDKYLE